MTDVTAFSQMTADHWWWRDGWQPGVRCLTWHATFQHESVLHAHASAYRRVLAGFPQLDLVPDEGLHMTMQGVGFVSEVARGDLELIIKAARRRLAGIAPVELVFDKPQFTPEAIRWDPQPADPVVELRSAIRAAIGEVWVNVPEAADAFTPHVTIGYGNRVAPAGALIEAIERADVPPVRVLIPTADLIVLGRDEHEYAWEYEERVPLGA